MSSESGSELANDPETTQARFSALWKSLATLGRDPSGVGYSRFSWTGGDADCREWFIEEALDRSLSVQPDRNGNLFAWWGDPEHGDAVVAGSHLDSVPNGGGYDGPLGIVSALLAIDLLRERGVQPSRPIGIAVFTEEEGARFGVACLGSRLLTGAIEPARAAGLVDRDGVTLAEAVAKYGIHPGDLGPDRDLLANIGHFLELHIEQGRSLADSGAPVGLATAIWPHGRWRIDLTGEGNHAGTTRMADRQDPALTLAFAILAANKEARLHSALATVGRVQLAPNAVNAVASGATAWLDARAPDQATLDSLVAAIDAKVTERAARDHTGAKFTAESATPLVEFDAGLRDRLVSRLGGVPVLPTGAGHDAGILAPHVPTGMLFVRNPTGVSHAPEEHATDADCAAGVVALADALQELGCR
jgi:N-carbamoyl-L-amino-acid hydrolase